MNYFLEDIIMAQWNLGRKFKVKMKKALRNLIIAGAMGLASLLPVKNAQSQDKAPIIDGWFEATAGINQEPNLRLYPTLNIKGVKLKSLTDINGFFSFTKTDLSHSKLELKLGKYVVLKPVATFYADPYTKKITADANITVSTDKYSGFFELDLNPVDIKNPEFFTYHSLATKIGSFGLFAKVPLKDIRSTYTELEFTAKSIRDCGISPYARANFTRGVRPTYQVGISVNPRKIIKKFKRNKKP